MIFGYFMKVTVLPILPGEAMLVSSVHQNSFLELAEKGANRRGLTFAVAWCPFIPILVKHLASSVFSPRFSSFLAVFPHIYIYIYMYIYIVVYKYI